MTVREIEKQVKATLKETPALSPNQLVNQLVERGVSDSNVRAVTWRLLDEGEITLDGRMRLILASGH
ncbi:hypothetical protein Dform_02029 [Dehalogenimonas formicexedens]|uniref:Uncharacterized protein n=1 Tax=Dehalogenimonas formicexedens TaxID=1839801 RepID=A0A1P8FA58_9CHLR|nr:hypothetical protein [Dehalogenimonas formicexedens]APV45342.1 hypothetical protein Dform_02029 [Dehalogenimonas formicexedens]